MSEGGSQAINKRQDGYIANSQQQSTVMASASPYPNKMAAQVNTVHVVKMTMFVKFITPNSLGLVVPKDHVSCIVVDILFKIMEGDGVEWRSGPSLLLNHHRYQSYDLYDIRTHINISMSYHR